MAATSHESDSHPAILEKLCLGFLQALVTEKIGFKFHISSGDFVCSLDFNGAGSPTQTRSPTVKVKRKSPSTRKRNADRRRLFLENKKRNGPLPVDTDQVRSAAASPAQVKARESQLDKVPEAEEREGRKRTGDRLAWINGQPALVPVTVDIASVYPEASLDLNPRPIHLQQENSGGSAESLDTSSDPSRDETAEVTEFNQVKTHPRPLQRARKRYKERTGNSPWENRHSSDCSPHVPAVESGKHPGEACLEPNEVQCKGCNSIMTLTQALKDLGWDAETLKQNPICAACINHWSF